MDETDRSVPGLPPRALIGMVHAAALPGAPFASQPLRQVVAAAVLDARRLHEAGFDAVLLENMHDRPYLRRHVGPETVAAMTAVAVAIREAVPLPLGVQILAGANREALAVAIAAGGAFIRAEGFVFASVADEGILEEADAAPLLRRRRELGAEQVAVLADVRKKHSSHAITGDLDVAAHAAAAAFSGADAVVVTGRTTGDATPVESLHAARHASPLPVVVGSGADAATLPRLLEVADAVIVGSSIKQDGHWTRSVDPARAEAFIRAAHRVR